MVFTWFISLVWFGSSFLAGVMVYSLRKTSVWMLIAVTTGGGLISSELFRSVGQNSFGASLGSLFLWLATVGMGYRVAKQVAE